MLKKLLNDDFFVELPISGGMGQSLLDPIVIETTSALEVRDVQHVVLTCINKALGRTWRIIEISHDSGDVFIEKVSFDAIYIEGNEVVTERLNFYFKSTCREQAADMVPTVSMPHGYRINLPKQMGWLHFSNLINNEPEHPGLGVTVAYSAPRFKATIYVYNLGLSVIDEDRLGQEFESATNQFLQVNSTAKELGKSEKDLAKHVAFDVEGAYTSLGLIVCNGYFIKLRVTAAMDAERHDFNCMNESVQAFFAHQFKS